MCRIDGIKPANLRLFLNKPFGGHLNLAKIIVITLMIIGAQSSCCCEGAESPADLHISTDICYTTVGNQPLHLDLIRLPAKSPQPLIICIHGGGWGAGTKHDMLEMSLGLAKVGYCVASVDYRLAPKNRFPAAVSDVKSALKYLKDHAQELKIDAKRIAVIGSSAGGHLALMLATTTQDIDSIKASSSSNPTPIRAAVSIAGPTDLSAPLPHQSELVVESFIGKKRAEAPELCREASPIVFVNRNSSPILFIHGDRDEIVPYKQSVDMLAACKKAGVVSELVTLHNRGHADGGDPKENEAAIRTMVNFLAQNLK